MKLTYRVYKLDGDKNKIYLSSRVSSWDIVCMVNDQRQDFQERNYTKDPNKAYTCKSLKNLHLTLEAIAIESENKKIANPLGLCRIEVLNTETIGTFPGTDAGTIAGTKIDVDPIYQRLKEQGYLDEVGTEATVKRGKSSAS